MNEQHKHVCCEKNLCGSGPFTRENYYFGKLLTAQALQNEQQYLNEKRWLINRYGIGWGVLCGLKVIPDCNNPCGGVIVEPGFVLDKYGNEILVCEPVTIDLKSACKNEEPRSGRVAEGGATTKKVYITIRYKECQTNPSPFPLDTCGKLEEKCVYNQTQETYKIDVTCHEPDKPKTIREEYEEVLACEDDCTHFLDNPAPLIIEKCQPRHKWCEITLACICYTEKTAVKEHHIDNATYRKLAFSNETLYAMIRCLTEEIRQTKGNRHDRRQHIPLLANTIKGLTYKDGKIAQIDAGIQPFRVTSDGDIIWITDLESPELIRIDRKTNELINPINLSCKDSSIESSWGIAFDGQYMWITHNNDFEGVGKLTRVNTCKLYDYWTFSALPNCESLTDCQKFCIERSGSTLTDLSPYPQEVVYHQNLLYVSHGWPSESILLQSQSRDKPAKNEQYQGESTTLRISIIDTLRCCLITTIDIGNEEYGVPISPISSMVSDGDALWITYTANFPGDDLQPVVRKIKFDTNTGNFVAYGLHRINKGQSSGKLSFDGTHLWLTHDDGASKLELATGNVVDHIETDQTQVAIAYGGGDNIWTAEYNEKGNKTEARLKRTDIHSVDCNGEIEYVSNLSGYIATDAQFDGVFIYVTGYSNTDDDTGNHGVIHRILP